MVIDEKDLACAYMTLRYLLGKADEPEPLTEVGDWYVGAEGVAGMLAGAWAGAADACEYVARLADGAALMATPDEVRRAVLDARGALAAACRVVRELSGPLARCGMPEAMDLARSSAGSLRAAEMGLREPPAPGRSEAFCLMDCLDVAMSLDYALDTSAVDEAVGADRKATVARCMRWAQAEAILAATCADVAAATEVPCVLERVLVSDKTVEVPRGVLVALGDTPFVNVGGVSEVVGLWPASAFVRAVNTLVGGCDGMPSPEAIASWEALMGLRAVPPAMLSCPGLYNHALDGDAVLFERASSGDHFTATRLSEARVGEGGDRHEWA